MKTVKVTPLCGVGNPLCYLLSVDGFNILLDCGWNDRFDPSLLLPLSRVCSTVDAVLLSYPDMLHLGALPYVMKQYGLSVPVYATEHVYNLGLLTMYDHYLSRKQVSEFDLFTLDDINAAFQNVTRLIYSQSYRLLDKGKGIVITPHVSGQLLGDTTWNITKDGKDIVYGINFNLHGKRTLHKPFVRPTMLITNAFYPYIPRPRRWVRHGFLAAIVKTLGGDGKVLLPVDTGGQVLELILILEQHWAKHHLRYPIFFLTCVSSSTIEYVKRYTCDTLVFLKHVSPLMNKSELQNVPDGPKIVLASMASLEAGFSHDIFAEWATDPKNLVLFTKSGQSGTLARRLQANPPPKAVKITLSTRVPLAGEELAAYEKEQNQKKEEALKASLNLVDLATTSHGSDSYHVGTSVRKYKDVLIYGIVSPSTRAAPMLPFNENSAARDHYCEVINPDDYVIKEENMEQSFIQGSDGKLGEGSASLLFDTTPSKVVSTELTVQVKCSLVYMDLEGCRHASSLMSIQALVPPLNLVLVNASGVAVEQFLHYYRKHYYQKHDRPHVYAPRIGDTVDLTPNLCAYEVQLSEELMSNVLFKKHGEYEVAWVDVEVGKTEGDEPLLLPLSSKAPPHKSVFIGDFKMPYFKQFLATKGVQAEFSGGALRCGEITSFQEVGDPTQKGSRQIFVRSVPTEEYYRIKDFLYSESQDQTNASSFLGMGV